MNKSNIDSRAYLTQQDTERLIALFDKAIELVECHDFLAFPIFNAGFNNLQRHREQLKQLGIMAPLFNYHYGKRPGLGLSRGFGDILPREQSWTDDIMNALREIESYYAKVGLNKDKL
jgi:hypothetical protein